MPRLYYFALFFLLTLWASCAESPAEQPSPPWPAPTEVEQGRGIKVPIYDYARFEPIMTLHSDSIYVINFWATWCIPCVQELPYFEKLQQQKGNVPVKVLLVSLDFRKKISSQLIPFIEERGLKAQVIALSDPDANSWISNISPNWSGALPATVVYHGKYRYFHEGSMTYEDLLEQIEKAKAAPKG